MLFSEQYADLRTAARVRERALFATPRALGELELQARWFAGDFGRSFVSTAGDKIEIVQFGTWNREAGPDFRDAAVRINGAEPVGGCIEIDLLDRNWETHGHASNPAFEGTALHVFVDKSDREFFSRTLSNRNVPQVRIDPTALPDAFSANIPLARPGRCQAPLGNLPEEQVNGVLDAAAQFRLKQKAARIRNKIDIRQSGQRPAVESSDHGRDEALFQEVAAALGYKENKLPFTLLAQRLPLKFLRDHGETCEAMIFGAAGFLQAPDLAIYKQSSKNYVRELWDRWWPHRDELQRLILPSKLWKITSTRPVNHPQRRLAALATLAREWPAFRRSLDAGARQQLPSPPLSPSGRGNPSRRGKKSSAGIVNTFLCELDHPFWKFHYTLTAEPSPKPMALIGESRVAEILANVIFPFWCAEEVAVWSEYAKLPARLTNRRLETGATRLFGNDPRRKEFLKTVAHQQGLLQIYEDFCLEDNSDCAQCPFPEQMTQWA